MNNQYTLQSAKLRGQEILGQFPFLQKSGLQNLTIFVVVPSVDCGRQMLESLGWMYYDASKKIVIFDAGTNEYKLVADNVSVIYVTEDSVARQLRGRSCPMVLVDLHLYRNTWISSPLTSALSQTLVTCASILERPAHMGIIPIPSTPD